MGPRDAYRTVEFAGNRGLRVIEDASHAIGTVLDDTPAGTLGDAGCVSTRGGNLLDSGEGGFLLTHDTELAHTCRTLRQHGQDPATATAPRSTVGYSYRLATPLAALARTHLARLHTTLHDHAQRTTNLAEHLRGTPGLVISSPEGPETWNSHSLLAHLDLPNPRSFSALLAARGITNSVGSHGLVSADQVPAFATYVTQPCLRARAIVDTTLAISLPTQVTYEQIRELAAIVAAKARDWTSAPAAGRSPSTCRGEADATGDEDHRDP